MYAVWFGLLVASSGVKVYVDVMQMKNVPVVLYRMDADQAARVSARANVGVTRINPTYVSVDCRRELRQAVRHG